MSLCSWDLLKCHIRVDHQIRILDKSQRSYLHALSVKLGHLRLEKNGVHMVSDSSFMAKTHTHFLAGLYLRLGDLLGILGQLAQKVVSGQGSEMASPSGLFIWQTLRHPHTAALYSTALRDTISCWLNEVSEPDAQEQVRDHGSGTSDIKVAVCWDAFWGHTQGGGLENPNDVHRLLPHRYS